MPAVFRWNIARREQLGRLVDGAPVDVHPAVLHELRLCCARVIAMAGDARLVFIGRSPEYLYDYLTGAFAGTSWAGRLTLLNISFKNVARDSVEPNASAYALLRDQFVDAGSHERILPRGGAIRRWRVRRAVRTSPKRCAWR